jgi:2-amino-4-hydroxy-6-hydroxymethyldihydropteridine diphosphokinase
MPEPHLAYLGLGANLNDPIRQVRNAQAELCAQSGIHVFAQSGLYRSKPDGYSDQPDYINAVVGLTTCLSPRELLTLLLDIERRHGRERTFRNSPRTLDLDILLYGPLQINEPGLHIPHPRMHERAFVLFPLFEIAPTVTIPGHGNIADLMTAASPTSLQRIALDP